MDPWYVLDPALAVYNVDLSSRTSAWNDALIGAYAELGLFSGVSDCPLDLLDVSFSVNEVHTGATLSWASVYLTIDDRCSESTVTVELP